MSGPGFIQGVPDFDKLEIVVVGFASVPTPNLTNWVTIPHNLGYRPMILAFLNNVGLSSSGTAIFTNGDIPLPSFLTETHTLVDGFIKFGAYMHATVDNTNAYVIVENATGSNLGTFPVKYYLLRERAN